MNSGPCEMAAIIIGDLGSRVAARGHHGGCLPFALPLAMDNEGVGTKDELIDRTGA